MERGVDEKETVLGSTDTETHQQTRYAYQKDMLIG